MIISHGHGNGRHGTHMKILAMRYLRTILKVLDRGCFAVFVLGGTFISLIPVLESTPLEFLLAIELYKIFVGVSVFLGWLALPVATLVFIFNTAMWFVGKAPWYWQSLAPLNFSFVLLTIVVFNPSGFKSILLSLMVLVACYFVIFWFLSSRKLHGDKVFEDKSFIFSLSVLVFGSLVLAIARVVNQDKNLDFLVPVAMETFAFAVAWLASSRKLYEDKVFIFSFLVLVAGSCYFNFKVLDFSILLFWGSFLLFISIAAGSSPARGSIQSNREPHEKYSPV